MQFRSVVRFAGVALALASCLGGSLITAKAEQAADKKAPLDKGHYIVTFKNYGKNSGRLLIPVNKSTQLITNADNIEYVVGRTSNLTVLRGNAILRTVRADREVGRIAADKITLTIPKSKR